MPALRIPDPYRPGLQALLRVPPETLDSLAAALTSAPRTLRWDRLVQHLAESVPSVHRDELPLITDALVALYSVRAVLELSLDDFIDGLLLGMRATGDFSEVPPDADVRLRKVLAVESLGTLSKARHLLNEYEHVFCSARILTDVRPVFAAEVVGSPVAALIVHTLRVHYHDAGEFKEIYFALDTDDLSEMRSLLTRAEEKAKSVRQFLDGSGAEVLEVS